MGISDLIENKQSKMSAERTFGELCDQFATAAAWVSRGWSELPKVNGGGHRDLKEICSKVMPSRQYLLNESREWFKHAVEIEDQEIIRLKQAV